MRQVFWSQFNSTIHINAAWLQIDKFEYLKCYMTGKEADAVPGLDLSETNYDVALPVLQEQFG